MQPEPDPYLFAPRQRLAGDVRGGDSQIFQTSLGLTDAVEAARRGEAHGWDVLFERFHVEIRAYALARLGHWADADDVTQETFVAAVGSVRKLRGDQEPVVQAWLLHICKHKVIDHLRRKVRAQRAVDLGVVASPDPAHMAETTMRAQEMRHALEELTEDQRDILVRRFVLDHSLDEVAAGTGRSVGAVKSLQHRALATLRRVLAARAA
jgi:RNA polymerase sigma-70 factor (ECF subfamily)